MNDFYLGIEHITDFAGYDHMLFLLSLVAWGSLKDIWRVIVLATAFTIGHSITLLLAGTGWVHADGRWIEFLIPVSIACTASWNLRRGAGKRESWGSGLTYAITVGFGLIHGLGFSSFFRMMREDGQSIVMPLLRFNLGVEAGQLLILMVCLGAASLLRAAGVTQREQQVFLCAVTGTLAVGMAIDRIPF